MRSGLLFFFTLLLSVNINAQTIKGRVLDKSTNYPLPNVSVYLDGTTISVSTDQDGFYELYVGRYLNTRIVFSHVSFETIIYSYPSSQIPEIVYMQEKALELDEALFIADRFTHKEKMDIFRSQFLGEDRVGQSCTILNEDRVIFTYDEDNRSLKAFANEPMVVHNSHTKYLFNFNIVHFEILFTDRSIKKDRIKQVVYWGTTMFQDVSDGGRKVSIDRDHIYAHSVIRFFKSIIDNNVTEQGYEIYRGGIIISPSDIFEVIGDLTPKIVRVKRPVVATKPGQKSDSGFETEITVVYQNRYQSVIRFNTEILNIDEWGNIAEIDKVLYGGEFGEQRAGYLLPINYSPSSR